MICFSKLVLNNKKVGVYESTYQIGGEISYIALSLNAFDVLPNQLRN